MRGQRRAPAALYPRERAGTHCTGGWVGPRTGLDKCGKSRPAPGFDPRTVHPVASRYTDCSIPADVGLGASAEVCESDSLSPLGYVRDPLGFDRTF